MEVGQTGAGARVFVGRSAVDISVGSIQIARRPKKWPFRRYRLFPLEIVT